MISKEQNSVTIPLFICVVLCRPSQIFHRNQILSLRLRGATSFSRCFLSVSVPPWWDFDFASLLAYCRGLWQHLCRSSDMEEHAHAHSFLCYIVLWLCSGEDLHPQGHAT